MLRRKLYKLGIVLRLYLTKNRKRFIVFNTPGHGNLGDHAIAKAQEEFLKNYFPGVIKIEVYETLWDYSSTLIKSYITKKDVIMMHGGGYLGDLWPANEKRAMNFIGAFPDNQVIFFPQTCYFNPLDKKLLNYNKSFYNKYPKIVFMLRDKNSECFMKHNMLSGANTCKLFPDMVTYLQVDIKRKRENTLLVCLREDHEKITDLALIQNIEKMALQLNLKIKYTTTVLEKKIQPYERDQELKMKWTEFASAKIVITDRLHGMIFAAITGTPCISFDNLSKKVSGVYEWIKYLDYVKCIEANEMSIETLNSLLDKGERKYDNRVLINYFDEMAELIRTYLE